VPIYTLLNVGNIIIKSTNDLFFNKKEKETKKALSIGITVPIKFYSVQHLLKILPASWVNLKTKFNHENSTISHVSQ
jgi:hypothetical protein